MNWFFSTVRVIGASLPFAPSLIQLQAELDADSIEKRVESLENPLNYLHEDIPELSKIVYEKLKEDNNSLLEFDDEFFSKYSRALLTLENNNCIKPSRASGRKYPLDIRLVEPSYILYMCTFGEEEITMESLVKLVEDCGSDKTLVAQELSKSMSLPIPVIQAVFKLYESKGYGYCSGGMVCKRYTGRA